MRNLYLAIAACLVAIPALASAQDKPPIILRAEECLVKKVDRIVAIEPDVQSAANFLLTFACAPEVSGAARYERNKIYVKFIGGMVKAMPQLPTAVGKPPAPPAEFTASVDPETGEIVLPPSQGGSSNIAGNMFAAMLPQMGSSAAGQITPEVVPVSLRKLAGDLVLAARERRTNAR
jgi:hypothetical protein